jgi:quinol monooxygenase YgiN
LTLLRINEFQAASGEAEALGEFLAELRGYITGSPGCESCELLVQSDADGAFVVLERWESEIAHKASLAGFPVERMQSAMALFGAPPGGAYYESYKA